MARQVQVPRERLGRWLDNFADRHGELTTDADPDLVVVRAADGAVATVEVPFPPYVPGAEPLRDLMDHVDLDRRVGLLAVRKGGHAVGVAVGEQLVTSKVGSGYVQGRTKAGGWSQQRYARRRDNQAQKAYADAADTTARLLLPELTRLDALITAGDRPAVLAVLADPRLTGLAALALPHVYPVPDPRLRILQALPASYLAITIGLNDLA